MVAASLFALLLVGCDGQDGAPGADGAAGLDGTDGADGVNCWDLNGNGVGDPEEDLNRDGVVDVTDCNAIASDASETAQLHSGYFTEHDYEGTQSCLNCHGVMGADMLTKAHFTWQGVVANITGVEGRIFGKNQLINNFCVAVPSNEVRCTECHAGYGYDDKTFNFGDMKNVDCLVCHDQSDTYVKALKAAGRPDPGVDLNAVARSVANNRGVPGIRNCINCHARAGGDDNVKHGDLALSLVDTTKEYDVHMGSADSGGGGMVCVDCHAAEKVDGKIIDHGIGGLPYHSVDEGKMKSCVDCHADAISIHVGSSVERIVSMDEHLTVDQDSKFACQVCHIPAIARHTATKVEWYWKEAGQDIDPPTDPATGRKTYAKKKGRFVWAKNVRPTLLYFDGKWDRMLIGVNEQYTTTPVDLGSPSADYTTPGAKIYPFKKMVGNQPADKNNKTMLVPHLVGSKGGPNPFWVKYDWNLALQDGASYAGQTYTGEYEFVDTFMYLTVNHEVAPKEMAYGYGGACGDCHFEGKIDWTLLGYTDDPLLLGGTRP